MVHMEVTNIISVRKFTDQKIIEVDISPTHPIPGMMGFTIGELPRCVNQEVIQERGEESVNFNLC